MSNDKMDATFNPGKAPVVPGHNDVDTGERPWVSPGTPPWAGQMAEKPKREGMSPWAWIGIGAAVLVVLVCGGGMLALSAGGSPATTVVTEDSAVAAPPSADQPAAVFKVGKTFRSGDFQYTIHGVKTGLAQVGGEYNREKAQGEFTRLDVTIKNVGDKPLFFDTDLRVKVEDKAGRQFSAATAANLVGNNGQDGWFTEINPGNSIRSFAYFDLPKGTTATRAVVSAGMLTFEADAIVPLR